MISRKQKKVILDQSTTPAAATTKVPKTITPISRKTTQPVLDHSEAPKALIP
jgi:hypothetical protein